MKIAQIAFIAASARTRGLRIAAASAALTTLAASSAGALTISLTPAKFQESASGATPNSIMGTSPGSLSGSNCYSGSGPYTGCQTSLATTSATGIKASVSGTNTAINGSDVVASASTAIIDYEFAVVGGSAAFVELNITGSVSASASVTSTPLNLNESAAEGEISYAYEGSSGYQPEFFKVRVNAVGNVNPDPAPASATLNASFSQAVGDIGDVEVYADCSAAYGACGATADPVISINPAFLATDPGATLLLSSGIVQKPIVTGVPEPSTWAMMLLGFAGLGFASWRGWRRTGAFTR
jgi:PEP-CTERM motif